MYEKSSEAVQLLLAVCSDPPPISAAPAADAGCSLTRTARLLHTPYQPEFTESMKYDDIAFQSLISLSDDNSGYTSLICEPEAGNDILFAVTGDRLCLLA